MDLKAQLPCKVEHSGCLVKFIREGAVIKILNVPVYIMYRLTTAIAHAQQTAWEST